MQHPLLHELLNVLPSQDPFSSSPSPPPRLIPSLSSSPPLPSSPFDPLSASFRPSIAVIIGVLTTMFSLTFLLLLYAKHCKRHGIGVYDRSDFSIAVASPAPPPPLLRARDSGVDRAIIDILPSFSFSSLHGVKDGLECAVCLSRFDMPDILRLLPKCKHAFHLECVDTWLSNHSTCPLCRTRVEADDVFIVEPGGKCSLEEQQQSWNSGVNHPSLAGRSSNAEQASGIDRAYQLYVQRESDNNGLLLSLDAVSRARNPSRKESICRSGSRKSKQGIVERSNAFVQPPDLDEQDFVRRFSHRIIISDALSQHRWSDFVPSDVLFLSSQTLSAGVRAMDAISGNNCSSGTEAMEGFYRPSASTVINPLSRVVGKSPSGRGFDASQGSTAKTDAPPRLSNSKIQDIFLSRLTGSRNSSKGAEPALLHSDGSGDVEVAVNCSKQMKEAPKGGLFERQASFLRRAFVTGRLESGGGSQMPSYQRSVSEVAGIRRYAEAGKSPSNSDEVAKQWLSIARTTLTWIMGGGKGRPFAGPSH